MVFIFNNQQYLLLSQRFLSAIRYLSCPNLSNHLRQNARVPKFLLMTFNSCFDFANLETNKHFVHRRSYHCSLRFLTLNTLNNRYLHSLQLPNTYLQSLHLPKRYLHSSHLPERYVTNIKVFHIMRTFHVIMNLSLSSTTKCLYSIELHLL